jgi:hypothetical protein
VSPPRSLFGGLWSHGVQAGASLAGNDSSDASSTISLVAATFDCETPSALAALRKSGGFTQSSAPYRPAPAQAACTEVTLMPARASLLNTSAIAPVRSSP